MCSCNGLEDARVDSELRVVESRVADRDFSQPGRQRAHGGFGAWWFYSACCIGTPPGLTAQSGCVECAAGTFSRAGAAGFHPAQCTAFRGDLGLKVWVWGLEANLKTFASLKSKPL